MLLLTPALVFAGSLVSFAQPEGEPVTVEGEVIDLWCYLESGQHGAEHKTCAFNCAELGNPIGIVTDAGEVYVIMGIENKQPGRDVLLQKMAEVVTVQGTLVRKGGTQAIYVSSVK